MQVMVTWQSVITAGAVIGALIALLGYLGKLYGWFSNQNKQDKDIQQLKEEQTIICYGLRACLDGLVQLGCNHSVPDALNELEKHLNKAAHK